MAYVANRWVILVKDRAAGTISTHYLDGSKEIVKGAVYNWVIDRPHFEILSIEPYTQDEQEDDNDEAEASEEEEDYNEQDIRALARVFLGKDDPLFELDNLDTGEEPTWVEDFEHPEDQDDGEEIVSATVGNGLTMITNGEWHNKSRTREFMIADMSLITPASDPIYLLIHTAVDKSVAYPDLEWESWHMNTSVRNIEVHGSMTSILERIQDLCDG